MRSLEVSILGQVTASKKCSKMTRLAHSRNKKKANVSEAWWMTKKG